MDKKDLKIASLLANNCRLPLSTIARSLDLSKDTIRNRINSIEEEGFITGYNTILDLRPVGISKFHMLIRLKNDVLNKTKVIDIIRSDGSISFANSFIGRYDFHVIFDTEDSYSFENRKKKILKELDPYIQDYISLNFLHDIKHTNDIPEISFDTRYKKRLDSSFSSLMDYPFSASKKHSKEKFDSLDIKILKILCEDPRSTLVSISDILKVNRETVKQRIAKLIKKRVILNFGANPSFERYGYVTYFFMIKTKDGISESVLKSGLEPLKNLFYTSKVQGRYDYLFYVLAKDPGELKQVMSRIKRLFGKDILDIELLIFDELHVYRQLPRLTIKELISIQDR